MLDRNQTTGAVVRAALVAAMVLGLAGNGVTPVGARTLDGCETTSGPVGRPATTVAVDADASVVLDPGETGSDRAAAELWSDGGEFEPGPDDGVGPPCDPGRLPSADDQGIADVDPDPSVGDHADSTVEFGLERCPGPGDRVWFDHDDDGQIDPDEPGIEGVAVSLFAATADGVATGPPLADTVTTEGGTYRFPCVAAGDLVVGIAPANFAPGGALAGLRPGAHELAVTDRDDHGDRSDDESPVPVAEMILLDATAQSATDGLGALAVLGAGQTVVDLEVTATGSWSAERNELTWSILVRNVGSEPETGTIVINDILPTGLGPPVISAPPGMTCAYDDTTRQITCTTDVGLVPNASLAITVVTARTSTALCNVSNTVTVRGTTIETSSANNVATASLQDLCAGDANAPDAPSPGSGLPRTGSGIVMVALACSLAGMGWKLTRIAADASTSQTPA